MPNHPAVILPDARDLAFIRGFRRLVARRAEDLCAAVGAELGKPDFETLTSEIVPLCSACRFAERRARRVLGPRRLGGGSIWQIGQRHRVVRAPLGRVGIIATWNYPLQLLGVQLVHAMVGGNRVVVKPSERSPACQGLLLDLAEEAARSAGLDPGRIERRPADREAGRAMLEDERFDHVVFTGSTAVGASIARTLAQTLTPSTLELSGCDSAIVLGDADVGLAAKSVAFALRLNGGQTCMAPRRVIAEAGVCGRFLDALVGELSTPRSATPVEAGAMARCRDLCAQAAEAGGRLIFDEPGAMVVAGCPVETALFRGEHFGPALAVVEAKDESDALRLHAAVEQKLATSVFTRDTGRARRLAAGLGSTVVTINDCVIPTGHPGVGIGGIGPSGWGVSRGEAGLLSMSRPVFVSETGRRVRTPTDEPSAKVRGQMARFVRRLYG